jgi:3'(2'), 5'-bisphosphate nucleotidase
MNDATPPVEEVLEIARGAARTILTVYDRGFDTTLKADASPLTAADTASHDFICAALRALTPGMPILSEESAALPYAERRAWSRYWLVDPLDGTREFIKRNGEFTVNIALIDGGRPMLGVVCTPVGGACHYARSGHGAFRSDAPGSSRTIRTRRAQAGRLTAVGSRSHGTPRQDAFFTALGPDTQVTSIGSSLKFCLVAEGAADVYPRFGPTSEWDTAAAHCVLAEAGGRVMTLDGAELRYNGKESLLNPEFVAVGDRDFYWQEMIQASDS